MALRPRIEVWIASHLDCPQRKEFFVGLLRALLTYQLDAIRVSISGLEVPENINSAKIEYYYHSARKLQFEHYKHLCAQALAQHTSPQTKIILIDDDDVLLPNFSEIVNQDQGLAMQVVAFSDFDQLPLDNYAGEFTPEEKSSVSASYRPVSKNGKLMLRVDHSGSWCLLENIDHFFRTTEEDIGYLTDRTFKKYLEGICGAKVSSQPIVMARKWTTVSFWAEDFAKTGDPLRCETNN
jgi:hypothetical protein